jgi:hypothetical protein
MRDEDNMRKRSGTHYFIHTEFYSEKALEMLQSEQQYVEYLNNIANVTNWSK